MATGIRNVVYSLFFALGLPAFLAFWGWRCQGVLALPTLPPALGSFLTVAGAGLLVWSLAAFLLLARKLPSNLDPPSRRLETGPYRWMSDPIYVGFCVLAFGLAALAGNAFAFWFVAPTVTLGAAALVTGFEASRRPPATPGFRPLLRFPLNRETPSALSDLAAVSAYSLVPWLAFIAFDLTRGSLEALHRPTVIALILSVAALVLMYKRPLRDLRSFVFSSNGVLFFSAAFLAPSDESASHGLVLVLGPAFLGASLTRRLPKVLATVGAYVLLPAVAMASWLTGSLYTVLATIFLAALSATFLNTQCIVLAERMANSWRAFRIGKLRVLNYAPYPLLASFVGMLLFCYLLGSASLLPMVIVSVSVLLGAGLWGQVIEGGDVLSRPFGYFGAVIGSVVGVVIALVYTDFTALSLSAAACVVAPWSQAIGRMRCLVQGCCHGRRIELGGCGIRVSDRHSRVLAVSGLDGVDIYPTPLYSAYVNAALGLAILKLAYARFPSSVIIAFYLITMGATRFTEEHYRGEVQTPVLWALNLYQWLSIGAVFAGIMVTFLPAEPFTVVGQLPRNAVLASILIAAFYGFAMGVDFPTSSQRFARLGPTE